MTVELPGRDEIEASILADSLVDYMAAAWPLVESRGFKGNWHIDAIAHHLEAVSKGEIRRLIINIPPRHMKSLSVAVFWPTWEWLRNPASQFMFLSYAQRLTVRDSLKCRRIIESEGGSKTGNVLERIGYTGLLKLIRQDWLLQSDQREKTRFENTEFGYRIATSVGGMATGEGGDILVIDDPHKADEVESDVERENVLEWLDGTLSTRLNDPATGRMVVVMQRLHEQDATGHLLEQGGWTHLCLPAEYEPDHPFLWPDDPRTEQGELLWPAHFNEEAITDLKHRLRHRASGQLQQRPAPAEGLLFKRRDLRYYTGEEGPQSSWFILKGEDENRHVDMGNVTRFQVADVAASDKTTADYTVVATFALTEHGELLVLNVARQRFDALQVHRFIEQENDRQGRPPIWIEQFGAGKAPLTRLRNDNYPAMALPTDAGIRLDKTARAFHAVALVEDNKLFLPVEADWLRPFEDELLTFPNATHDDQVDTLSYGARMIPQLTPSTYQRQTVAAQPISAGIRNVQF